MTAQYVLITRPAGEAQAVADAVRERGFKPFVEPMLEIRPVAATLPALSIYDALVFTSANAVRAFCALESPRDLPVYAVGPETAAAAKAGGFETVMAGPGGVQNLLEILPRDKKLLHLSGDDVAKTIPGADRVVIYKAAGAQGLSAEALALLDSKQIFAALFFSPRTAQVFIELVERYGRTDCLRTIRALCISDSVLKCLHPSSWQNVQVAAAPHRAAILELLST